MFLNQARLLYALKKYDEADDRLSKEDRISGVIADGRFLLLRGNIAFRRAVLEYEQSAPKVRTTISPGVDVSVLEQSLLGSEDNFRESLRITPTTGTPSTTSSSSTPSGNHWRTRTRRS